MSAVQNNYINIMAAGTPVGYTQSVNFGSGFVVSQSANVITVNFTGGTPTGAENYEAAYNPINYGALGGGADDQTAVQNCFNDAITVKNATIYLSQLFYISRGILVPNTGFKLPQIASVDTSAYVITFSAGHGHLPGDVVLFQGMAPAGALPGVVYFGNFSTSTTTSLYTSQALALAGGSTGRVPLTGGVTTTGTIAAGSRTLVVAAELGAKVGTTVTIGPLSGPIGGSSGGFTIIGGIGSGTTTGFVLNTTNASSTQTNVLVTYNCWLDWRFFDGGLKMFSAPGGGLKKHHTWNTSQSSALLNVAIGANVLIDGTIFEGLSNMMVPQGTTGTITANTNILTVNDATWARNGMAITIGDYGVTSRIRSVSGNVITLMANVPNTVSYTSPPAVIRGQITSGVIGLTGTGTGGTNTVTMNSVDGLCPNLSVVFDTISGTYVITAVNPSTKVITLSTNLSSSITNNILSMASDAGDDGLRVSSVHNAEIRNCILRHCGDAGFREQTNVYDYQAATTSNPYGGVNTGEIRFVHNYVYNCYQTASTTNDYVHGGAQVVHFEDNTFWINGSVKFANRVPGGRDLWLLNNKIRWSYNHGFEIDSNSRVNIKGNSISNVYNQGVFVIANNGPTNVAITAALTNGSSTIAVTSTTGLVQGMSGNLAGNNASGVHYQQAYTILTVVDGTHLTISPTPTDTVASATMSIYGEGIVGFPFDGLTIEDTEFDNCGQGSGTSAIRIGPDSYADGTLWDYPGVRITKCIFKNSANTSGVTVNLVNGSFVNFRFEDCDFQNIQATNLLKITGRSSNVSGFVNGFQVNKNNFNMNNSAGTAVSISGTVGTSGIVPQLNEIDLGGNLFTGSCLHGIILENVNNARIKKNRMNLVGGTFFLPNNTNGYGQLTNITFDGNDMETTNTFGYSLANITNLYILNNKHKIASGSSTASISNSCQNVYYLNNNEVGGTPNFNQVPVNTKALNSVLRLEEGTAVPSSGTWTQGSILVLTNAVAGGTQWRCTTSGTFGTPTGSPTASTDGSTNTVTFNSMAAISLGCWINVAGAWTGARQVTSIDPIAKTGIVSGATPALVTSASVTYVPPIFSLTNSFSDGEATFSNANYAASVTDTYILQTGTMTAAHAVTLPLAANVKPGHRVTIQDGSGTATNINAIQTAPNGSDTINGSNSTRNDITTGYASASYRCDGISKWFKE